MLACGPTPSDLFFFTTINWPMLILAGGATVVIGTLLRNR